MLVYFVKGRLPWQSIEASSKDKKYKEILAAKQRTSIQQLCKDLPSAFEEFLLYARALEFAAEPDMSYLKKLFAKVQKEMKYEESASTPWEWEAMPWF